MSEPNKMAGNDKATSTNPTNGGGTGNEYSITVWGVVVSGTVGFMLAVYLLLGWPFNNKYRFHEIDIHAERADSTATERLSEVLNKQHGQLKENTEKVAGDFQKTESVILGRKPSKATPEESELLKKKDEEWKRLAKRTDSVNSLLKNLQLRRFNAQYKNGDTAGFKEAKFSLRRERLTAMIQDYTSKGAMLELGYYNPEFSTDTFTIRNPVTTVSYSNSFDFFSKYPNFAFWVFIWILQMVGWFLILPVCIFIYERIKELNAVSGTVNRRGKSLLIAGGSLGLFTIFLYLGIMGKDIITDKIFMRGFGTNLFIYAFIGYTVAFLCFAGYLYIADFLHQLQQKYKEGSAALNNILTSKKAEAGANEAALAAIEKAPDVQSQRQEVLKIKERFLKAKKYFNLFLWMCAIVLSMLVICTASLFNSVNSLEVFSFYKYLSGRSFLSGDLVYLYGGFHSIILLIFVLPARFKMMDMSMSIPELQEEENGEDGKGGTKILKGIGKALAEVLVVSSPLLASLLQNVVNSWFN
ncbi:MAG: hypothetical protein JNK14_07685 [Chitinophagaceae bacterium]|nr:hypothetical protein [Chitinophagaceae bacterium]